MRYANVSPKMLVVYYSRGGNTRRVAQGIVNASGADLEEIRDEAGRGGPLGYLRSGFEAMLGREARIRPSERDPRAYDIVILGSPVWGASLSSPVRSYLAAQRAWLPEVAFFVTLGGRAADRVLDQMQTLAGKRPLGKMALSESYLVKNPAVIIGEFLESVLVAWERRSRRSQPLA